MNNKEIKKWHKLIKKNKAWCYIKKNRYKHDSGWGCFEIGYMTTKKQKMKDKIVIGIYTDHIWFANTLENFKPERINMDVTLDGYIRFFCGDNIIWRTETYGLSSMKFMLLKDYEE